MKMKTTTNQIGTSFDYWEKGEWRCLQLLKVWDATEIEWHKKEITRKAKIFGKRIDLEG